jgi:hypothetical protein
MQCKQQNPAKQCKHKAVRRFFKYKYRHQSGQHWKNKPLGVPKGLDAALERY